jgi:hypothetical protein
MKSVVDLTLTDYSNIFTDRLRSMPALLGALLLLRVVWLPLAPDMYQETLSISAIVSFHRIEPEPALRCLLSP